MSPFVSGLSLPREKEKPTGSRYSIHSVRLSHTLMKSYDSRPEMVVLDQTGNPLQGTDETIVEELLGKGAGWLEAVDPFFEYGSMVVTRSPAG